MPLICYVTVIVLSQIRVKSWFCLRNQPTCCQQSPSYLHYSCLSRPSNNYSRIIAIGFDFVVNYYSFSLNTPIAIQYVISLSIKDCTKHLNTIVCEKWNEWKNLFVRKSWLPSSYILKVTKKRKKWQMPIKIITYSQSSGGSNFVWYHLIKYLWKMVARSTLSNIFVWRMVLPVILSALLAGEFIV